MQSANTQVLNTERKKSHKLLWVVGILVTVFIVVPVLVAGWLGFVPGLSNLLGAREARDLQVYASEKDLNSYNQKAAIQFKDYAAAPVNPANPAEKQVFGQLTNANNLNITQEELTSAINDIGWSWFPVKNMQVRFGEGTVEISGYVNSENLDNFASYIDSSGNTSDNVSGAVTWINRFAEDMPFYAKATAGVVNNQLTFRLIEAEIGRLDIPLGSLGQDLNNGTSLNIGSDKLNIQSAQLKTGKLLLTGIYPSEIYIKQ